ncbi:MAG: hypothetical protein K2Z80_37685 [Xanthobacteraceae bacterium]|nr:hypothetical protein [Xanthobacteraceae bacterium]
MTAAPASRIRSKLAIWLLAGVGALMLVGANSHLVYVALLSQPDCVEHRREAGAASGQFRAAKSSCAPARQAPKTTAEVEPR